MTEQDLIEQASHYCERMNLMDEDRDYMVGLAIQYHQHRMKELVDSIESRRDEAIKDEMSKLEGNWVAPSDILVKAYNKAINLLKGE